MKIISTLGPASFNKRFIDYSLQLGQPYFRINGSHLSPSDLDDNLAKLLQLTEGHATEITLDIQGGKQRIGTLKSPISLNKGDLVCLVNEIQMDVEKELTGILIPVSELELLRYVPLGKVIHLQDNQIQLQITEINNNGIFAKVITASHPLRSRAGIWINGMPAMPNGLPKIQIEQLQIAAKYGLKKIAISFVSRQEDIQQLIQIFDDLNYKPQICAKIERPEAMENLEQIAETSHEVWFCRGDLGAMVPIKELGKMQASFLKLCHKIRIPAVIAGQVFHHLTGNEQPTRSEVVHFYHLTQAGVDGIVLSDETAIGINPINAVSQISQLL